MKTGYTDINIVLDRSGSMDSIKDDTIEGVNTFLADQKALPGEATFTLAQFDHEYETIYEAEKLSSVKPLDGTTFVPRGRTALLDAIGRTINATGKRLADLPEHERPEKVIFVIVTDGQENDSKEFRDRTKINEMITHQRESYAWEFVFLGANQDAIAVAGSIGITRSASMTYAANATGVSHAFAAISKNMASYRAGGQVRGFAFDEEDRKKQKDAGVK